MEAALHSRCLLTVKGPLQLPSELDSVVSLAWRVEQTLIAVKMMIRMTAKMQTTSQNVIWASFWPDLISSLSALERKEYMRVYEGLAPIAPVLTAPKLNNITIKKTGNLSHSFPLALTSKVLKRNWILGIHIIGSGSERATSGKLSLTPPLGVAISRNASLDCNVFRATSLRESWKRTRVKYKRS